MYSLILFGGENAYDANTNNSTALNNEIWALKYDGSKWDDSWTLISNNDGPDGGPEFEYQYGQVPMEIVGDKMYVMGRRPGDGLPGINTDMWSFDLVKNEWDVLKSPQNAPGERGPAATFVYDGALHMYGGQAQYDGVGTDDYNDLWRYDAEENKWTEIDIQGAPGKDREFGYVLDGDKLYLVGDYGDSEVWVLDLKDNQFNKMETTGDEPYETLKAAVAVVDNTLLVATSTGYPSNDLWELNLDTKVWSRTDAGSIGSYGWATTSYGGKIFIHGGYCGGAEGETCGCSSAEQCSFQTRYYDISNDRWMPLPNLKDNPKPEGANTVNPYARGSTLKVYQPGASSLPSVASSLLPSALLVAALAYAGMN